MSSTRVYNAETIAIITRFYVALDMIIAQKKIRGIKTYCSEYNIDRRHLYAQREDKNKGFFEVYWLIPLIKDFGVSSEWLLLGRGGMFKNTP